MDHFIIRECTAKDVNAIYELNSKELGYDFPIKSTQKQLGKILLDGTQKIFVAVRQGSVVGYIHLNSYDVLYFEHLKNIMGIAVFSEFKRNGIGKKLLQIGEKWAQEDGAIGIRLVSGAERTDAHQFYLKCGYIGNKLQKNFKKVFN